MNIKPVSDAIAEPLTCLHLKLFIQSLSTLHKQSEVATSGLITQVMVLLRHM